MLSHREPNGISMSRCHCSSSFLTCSGGRCARRTTRSGTESCRQGTAWSWTRRTVQISVLCSGPSEVSTLYLDRRTPPCLAACSHLKYIETNGEQTRAGAATKERERAGEVHGNWMPCASRILVATPWVLGSIGRWMRRWRPLGNCRKEWPLRGTASVPSSAAPRPRR